MRTRVSAAAWRIAEGAMVAAVVLQTFAFAVPAANAAAVTPMVSAGYSHSVALKSDGTVWAWGLNSTGELGNNTTISSNVPIQVHGASNVGFLTGIKTVAAGIGFGDNSFALKSDGTVWAWGDNTYSQLGNGTTGGTSAVPVQVSGLTGITAIAAGSYTGLALKSDGTVWAWGYGTSGQLGNNLTASSNVPIQVHGALNVGFLSGVTTISEGFDHSLVILSDNSLWGWGNGASGQLGINAGSSSVPVQVHGPSNVGFLTSVTGVAGGRNHSVAVKSDGTVWAWGYGTSGQLGNGTGGDGTNNFNVSVPVQVLGAGGSGFLTGVTAVSANYGTSAALKSDGTVWSWGDNYNGDLGDNNASGSVSNVPVQASGLTGATSVSAGGSGTQVLKSDGTVWGFGYNSNGELGNGTSSHDGYNVPVQVHGAGNVGFLTGGVTSMAGGSSHSVALKSDGTVWAWGFNSSGQLGDGTTTKSDVPVQVSGLAGVTSVSAGPNHSVARKSDGTVWTWGDNTYGQLGDGATGGTSPVPVQVSGLTGVTSVAGGQNNSVALKSDGTVWAWGYGVDGELGNFANGNSNLPVQVHGVSNSGFLTDITAISDNDAKVVLALKSDGTVYDWGYGSLGGLGNGANSNSNVPVQVSGLAGVTAVSSSYGTSAALKSDGTVWTWGYGYGGALGNGANSNSNVPVQVSGLAGVTGVAVTGFGGTALKSDGTVWAWGYNGYGELGNGTDVSSSNVPVQVDNTNLASSVTAVFPNYMRDYALKSDGSLWSWGGNQNGALGNGTFAVSATAAPVQSNFTTAAVLNWTGGGSDNNWSTAANWDQAAAPVSADSVVFGSGGVGTRPSPVNDIAVDTAFGTITVSASGYTISGNAVSPTGGLVANTYASGTSTVGLVIDGAGSVTKSGAGTLVLSGTNTYTGTTTTTLGILQVDGAQSGSAVSLNGGTLAGTGTVGAMTVAAAGSAVSPGDSPGTLHVSDNMNWSAHPTTYVVELNGTGVGTDYDQLTVAGTVNVTGATLSATAGFSPALGNTFIIINNDGVDAVVGTFSGLAEGAVTAISGLNFRITYVGGTGNDVVLTYVGPVDATMSTLTPASASLIANGITTQALIVTAKYADGSTVAAGSSTVLITKSSGVGTISSVTDNGDGTYTALASSTQISTGTFVATLGGSPVKNGTGTQTVSTVTFFGSGGGGGGAPSYSLTVTAPNGGETFSSGSTVPVSWTSNLSSTTAILITLSTDGGATFPVTVASLSNNNGYYSWSVPSMTTTTTARIKVEAVIAASDLSDADFSIAGTALVPPPVPPPASGADSTSTGAYASALALANNPSIDVDKGLLPPAVPASCAAGTLIKASTAAVYYCGADGKRYVFPNLATYLSWYTNFSNVIILTDVQLAAIPLGGNVTSRPGARMVKIQTDPKVYAISRGGLLRWVTSESVAAALYGANWNRMIDDVSDAFFVNYKLGDPITSAQ